MLPLPLGYLPVRSEGIEPPLDRVWTGRLYRWATSAKYRREGSNPHPCRVETGCLFHSATAARLQGKDSNLDTRAQNPQSFRWTTLECEAASQRFEL